MTDYDRAIPTGEEERKKFKAMIVEMTNTLSRIDAEREHLKEIGTAAQDEFGIKKAMVNKIARTMYKQNYADIHAENEHFEHLYETITDSGA